MCGVVGSSYPKLESELWLEVKKFIGWFGFHSFISYITYHFFVLFTIWPYSFLLSLDQVTPIPQSKQIPFHSILIEYHSFFFSSFLLQKINKLSIIVNYLKAVTKIFLLIFGLYQAMFH